MDLARHLPGQSGHRLELLARGRNETLGRAEVVHEQPLSRRAHARQIIEDRAGHRLVAAAAVELDRKAVRLVADALKEMERCAVAREYERLGDRGGKPPRCAWRARSP